MGRGRGGYTEKQIWYKDSGGFKVTDPGAKIVAERYIDQGYESVFRQRHEGTKTYDLTIKTSDDQNFVKNIEVKKVTSSNPSKLATNIGDAFKQIQSTGDSGSVAIYLEKMTQTPQSFNFAKEGYEEAKRKGWVKGPVEIWFNDKTKLDFN